MNKKTITINLLTLIVALIAFFGMISLYSAHSNGQDPTAQKKIQQLESKATTNDQKIKDLQKQIDSQNKQIKDLKSFFEKSIQPKPTQPTPAPVKTPEIVEKDGHFVVNVDALNFRDGPSLSNHVNRLLIQGEVLTDMKQGNQTADGYTWTEVKDSNGQIGWIATQFTQFKN